MQTVTFKVLFIDPNRIGQARSPSNSPESLTVTGKYLETFKVMLHETIRNDDF